MKNNLTFLNKTTYNFRFLKDFREILDHAQKILKFPKFIEVDFVLVDDNEMQKLSKKYRKKDKTTDILSFPSDWKQFLFMDSIPLGEIVISFQKVKQQSIEYNHTLKREYCYLFAHGILHLYGLDHQTKDEEDHMNQLADKIMEKMGIQR